MTRYDCAEAFSRVQDYLDRELSAEETVHVREHLETCERCAHEFRFEARVLDTLKQRLRRVDVPESLRARVAHAIDAAR